MFEVMATLAVLVIGGALIGLVAVAGVVVVALVKLIFFPVAMVFDFVKWIGLLVVVPLALFVVIPIALVVILPVMLAALVPIAIGLFAAIPIVLLVLVGKSAAQAA